MSRYKRIVILAFALIMTFLITSCGEVAKDGNSKVTENLVASIEKTGDKMELTKILKSGTKGKTSLEELVNEFEKMCQIKVDNIDEDDDLNLFETGVFDFNGKNEFYFSLVRQFPNGEDEYYQLHLDVIYDVTNDNKDFESCIWSDEVEGNFFDEVRNSKEYNLLKDMKFKRFEVNLDET